MKRVEVGLRYNYRGEKSGANQVWFSFGNTITSSDTAEWAMEEETGRYSYQVVCRTWRMSNG
jgi:hypothetical protein